MRRLQIDFVQTSLWRLPIAARDRQILLGAAAVVVLAVVVIAWQCWQLDRQIDAASRATVVARRELLQRTPPPRAPLVLAEQQIVAINDAIGQLNIPWPALLDGFETVATPDIALLQIEPDPHPRLIKGLAEAKNHQRMLAYLAALGSTRPFAGAMVSKQEVNEKDPHRPLRFLFEVRLEDHSPAAAGGQGKGKQ